MSNTLKEMAERLRAKAAMAQHAVDEAKAEPDGWFVSMPADVQTSYESEAAFYRQAATLIERLTPEGLAGMIAVEIATRQDDEPEPSMEELGRRYLDHLTTVLEKANEDA